MIIINYNNFQKLSDIFTNIWCIAQEY